MKNIKQRMKSRRRNIKSSTFHHLKYQPVRIERKFSFDLQYFYSVVSCKGRDVQSYSPRNKLVTFIED